MRILIVCSETDRTEDHLYRSLSAQGHNLHIVCDPNESRMDDWRGAGMNVTPLRFRNRLDGRATGVLAGLIRESGPEIVQAMTNKALACTIRAMRGNPARLITYRGTIGHVSRLNPASYLTHLNRRIDRIVCVSDAVQNYLHDVGIPMSRLERIYKGHAPEWYTAAPREKLATLGIPPDAFVVVLAGRLRPVKGAHILLEAAQSLPADGSLRILLLGEIADPRLARMLRLPARHPVVHHAGFRPDAAALIGACDALVMPSIAREGLPRAVLEGMAQGVTPIVTDVGGLPEIVSDNQNGMVVRANDAGALATAIGACMANPQMCRRFGERARESIRTTFNVEETVKQYVALYERLT